MGYDKFIAITGVRGEVEILSEEHGEMIWTPNEIFISAFAIQLIAIQTISHIYWKWKHKYRISIGKLDTAAAEVFGESRPVEPVSVV